MSGWWQGTRVATDSNDLLVWTLDETTTPFALDVMVVVSPHKFIDAMSRLGAKSVPDYGTTCSKQ
jgi:hypothetical protein